MYMYMYAGSVTSAAASEKAGSRSEKGSERQTHDDSRSDRSPNLQTSNDDDDRAGLLSLLSAGGCEGLAISEVHQRRMEAEFEAEFGLEFGGTWSGVPESENCEGSGPTTAVAVTSGNSSDPRNTGDTTGK